MTKQVLVNDGARGIRLPDGNTYDGPTVVTLTDEQFSAIPLGAFFNEILTDMTGHVATVPSAPGGGGGLKPSQFPSCTISSPGAIQSNPGDAVFFIDFSNWTLSPGQVPLNIALTGGEIIYPDLDSQYLIEININMVPRDSVNDLDKPVRMTVLGANLHDYRDMRFIGGEAYFRFPFEDFVDLGGGTLDVGFKLSDVPGGISGGGSITVWKVS